MNKQILVAIAWPYVNGDLHVGHLAGYLLPADIFARYQRLRGNDVLMVSGSDCYGTPITVEADKQGLTSKEVVEKYHQKDIKLFKQYGLSYNLYTKTTTDNHKRVVQELFLDLLKNDIIVKDTMKQYYAEEDEEFLPDRYVEGTCPHCDAKDQRSDQCESCGRWLEDGELIDPKSKLTGSKVILKDTQHYFLDFANPKLQEKLKKYVDGRKSVWRKWVWNEANGWLKEGLRKRAITRDIDWGIDLPVDAIKKLGAEKQLADFKGKKLYVWFEAVIGYLSAPQEWVELDSESKDIIFRKDDSQSNDWTDWWKNENSEHYYFMGQDNLVFHTLMWPAELIGSTENYTLPENVIVNKFMNYEGKKFSKSRNWTIDSRKIAEKYGVDSVRYYIAANLPEKKEANFTWEGFVDGVNNELVANLGNFINRTLKFLESKFEGNVSIKDFVINEELKNEIEAAFEDISKHLKKGEFVAGLNRVMKLARAGNKYFDEKQIWQVIKDDKDEAKLILLNQLNLVYNLKVLMFPFIPEATNKLAKILGEEALQSIVGTDSWQPKYISEISLAKSVEPLFQKLDREVVLKEKDR